jgi:hypothetical protein
MQRLGQYDLIALLAIGVWDVAVAVAEALDDLLPGVADDHQEPVDADPRQVVEYFLYDWPAVQVTESLGRSSSSDRSRVPSLPLYATEIRIINSCARINYIRA